MGVDQGERGDAVRVVHRVPQGDGPPDRPADQVHLFEF